MLTTTSGRASCADQGGCQSVAQAGSSRTGPAYATLGGRYGEVKSNAGDVNTSMRCPSVISVVALSAGGRPYWARVALSAGNALLNSFTVIARIAASRRRASGFDEGRKPGPIGGMPFVGRIQMLGTTPISGIRRASIGMAAAGSAKS